MQHNRAQIVRNIMRKVGVPLRNRPSSIHFTKRELLHLSSYLDTVIMRLNELDKIDGEK